ncbi:MAG: UbiD family decarboxylase [Burkholderiales bacterium]|nr:UbiD family decarboxylase [Burkholderiales bacterium]
MVFGDLRGWIDALRAAGELHEIDAEVHWDRELGTITRKVFGRGDGPALLFNNITDHQDTVCRRLFTGGLSSYRRLAMMLGLPKDTPVGELVKKTRAVFAERLPPKVVATGPVKENIITGADIDLHQFPAPRWHARDGGRYINTYAGCVTRDPETGIHNVGIYRGLIGQKNTIPVLLFRPQHWGQHFTKYERMGTNMPIAYVYGWEPSLGFCAGGALPGGVCEYDVMGAIRGAPVELVKCETSDILVPASAEIVIEGFISSDPATFEPEGPFGEFTGYFGGERAKRHSTRVTCITHRNDPIMRGTLEGAYPGHINENAIMSSVQRAAIAWNVLDRAGVPGVTDVHCPPIHMGVVLMIQIEQSYRGQAKQAAMAIWGSGAAHNRYKHIWVVDRDIDIRDYSAIDWAYAFRVNAAEGDILTVPGTFGVPIDPSTRLPDRDALQFGTGKWCRVLIDATVNFDYRREEAFGGERYPPSVKPPAEDLERVERRWHELGFEDR